MKCEKCGNIIDSDDLVCRFCSADSQSPGEDIEVLNEVEENPSIVFSENISIEDLSVAKPKKKRKKKKKKQTEEDNIEETNDKSEEESSEDSKKEKSSKKETKKEKEESSDKEDKNDKKKSSEKSSDEKEKKKDDKKSSKKETKKEKEESSDKKVEKKEDVKEKDDSKESIEEKNEESISDVLENIYEERDLKSKIINKEDSTDDVQEELSEEDHPELDNTFVEMKEVFTDKIHVDPSEDEYGEKIFDIENDPEALVEDSNEEIDKTIFEEIKEENKKEIENVPEEVKEETTVEEEKLSDEIKGEATDKETEDNSEENNEDNKKDSEEVITKEVTDNTVYDIPKIISSEEYVIENTQEPEDAYEPFVKSDEIVPLPPKKTLLFRIKDFYNSMFEGYEKAEEIKVDDREARLTLDKIYDTNSKKLKEKRIHMNEVVMVWLMCFVLAFFLFFVFTCISFILDIAFGSHNNIPLLVYIIPFFQIVIPSILTCSGGLIGVIYSVVKHSKKSNR